MVLELFNKKQADALRTRNIAFMCDTFGDYQDPDIETLNADIQSRVT